MKRVIPLALISLCVLACTDKKKADNGQPEVTQRQRDSVIGESALPGAQGVRGALGAADSAAARQRRAAEIN